MIKLKNDNGKYLYDLKVSKEYSIELSELKEGEKISILSDTMLKAMFQNSNRLKYSAKFLSYFIDLSYEEILNSIHLSKNELDKNKENDKGLRCDYVGVIDDTSLNIEVNNNSSIKTLERNMEYAHRLYSRKVKRKGEYRYQQVIQFNLNNFSFIGNDNIVETYYSCNEEGLRLDNKIIFIQIYVPNLVKKCYTKGINELKEMERFILTLVEKNVEYCKQVGKGINIMEEYEDEAEEVSYDEDIGESYSLEWALKDEGKKEGIKEGSYNKSIEIAKSMLEEKIDINTVSKCTKLSIEEIKKLK